MMNKQNFYEILEIGEDATLQDIERAYTEAKETYSPTSSALYSMFSQDEAQELHNLIEQAYNTLSNQDLRREYDEKVLASLDSGVPLDNSLYLKIPESNFNEAKVQGELIIKDFSKDSSIESQIKELNDCSGSFLQKVRKYKNISLDEVSKFSKVSKTNILAVEEEDFDNLPAKVFIRGFVIQVCKLLGIDPEAFSKEYLKSLDEHRKK